MNRRGKILWPLPVAIVSGIVSFSLMAQTSAGQPAQVTVGEAILGALQLVLVGMVWFVMRAREKDRDFYGQRFHELSKDLGKTEERATAASDRTDEFERRLDRIGSELTDRVMGHLHTQDDRLDRELPKLEQKVDRLQSTVDRLLPRGDA